MEIEIETIFLATESNTSAVAAGHINTREQQQQQPTSSSANPPQYSTASTLSTGARGSNAVRLSPTVIDRPPSYSSCPPPSYGSPSLLPSYGSPPPAYRPPRPLGEPLFMPYFSGQGGPSHDSYSMGRERMVPSRLDLSIQIPGYIPTEGQGTEPRGTVRNNIICCCCFSNNRV